MKTAFLFLAMLLAATTNFSRTWVVSNVVGFPADHSDLQACVDAASNGDIILVQGSGGEYGDIEVRKRLVIMGPGYFLNQNPETQVQNASAKVKSFRFAYGSSGSILQGIDVVNSKNFYTISGVLGQYGTGSINIDSSSVTVISCKAETNGLVIKDADNVTIIGCYVHTIACNSTSSNVTVQSNIIRYHCDLWNAQVVNNYINFEGGQYQGFGNCSVKNNFLTNTGYWIGYVSGGFSNTNSTFINNCFIGCNSLGSNSGTNLINIDGNSLFIGVPTQGSYSNDGKFKLKSGSPAIGAGENGVDIGPFGGSDPYKLSGISFHPNIWSVTMPTTGTSGGGLQVQVKVNAND